MVSSPTPLPLEALAERCERILRLSPADATIVTWIETARGHVVESARTRRAEAAPARSVVLRVREGGRTGCARAESAEVGELQTTLRQALASARLAPPSPDWEFPAGSPEPALDTRSPVWCDPEIVALQPATAQQRLQRLADRRATLRFSWGIQRLAVAASGRATRTIELTDATLEARTGRRPGSGFAAGASRSLSGLDLDEVIGRARQREASEVSEPGPAPAGAAVLAPEVTAVLVETFVRLVFSGRRFVAGVGPLADPAERRKLANALHVTDRPLDGGLALPIDLDGIPKRSRDLVVGGDCREVALDLELGARCGRLTTGCSLASDDAYPLHPCLTSGEVGEAELLARSAGGLRVGSIEYLRCIEAPGLPFRALARSVRKIGEGGDLGVALPPLYWKGKLLDLFSAIDGIGRDLVVWSAGGGLGAASAPALRVLAAGELTPSAEGRI